ncbi:MAG: sulfite exporter TauE/SafE family protein [Saprospiraceae bacterium]
MTLEWWVYPVAIFGGFLAGFINTLAGNGSAITLTILMELMGLPPQVANGSNRVGVMAQTSVSSIVFYQEGKIDFKKSWHILLLVFIGAMFGLWLTLNISNEGFRTVFGVMMVVMLGVILVNPKRWIEPQKNTKPLHLGIMIPVALALGFYGGFIQMGMGVMFLAFIVLVAKYDIIHGNAIKSLSVGIYTVVVLGFFAYKGLVDWQAGGLLAIGQVGGSWLSSRFAATHPKAGVYAHRILVVVVIFAILKVFLI